MSDEIRILAGKVLDPSTYPDDPMDAAYQVARAYLEAETKLEDHQRKHAATKELVGYMLSVRRNNTPEWMKGLADSINRWAWAVGEPDRAVTFRDTLQVITPQDVILLTQANEGDT